MMREGRKGKKEFRTTIDSIVVKPIYTPADLEGLNRIPSFPDNIHLPGI
jgi:hypothetical protein